MSEQERFNAVFQTRLRELIKRRGTTITALAKELGISRQAVSQYADGTGQPNIDKLVLIAGYFDVSTDYLSGIAEFERVENENVLARDLGLSEQSVNILKFFAGNPEYPSFIQTLNYLIEQETPPPDSFSIGTWDGMTKAEYEKAASDAEEEFDRSYMKWEQMGYVPILSAVHDFFLLSAIQKNMICLAAEKF